MENAKKYYIILSVSLLVSSMLVSCADGRIKDYDDWNRRDKGALIGGAGGSVVGGIVGSASGNTGAGAVIGGAVGAGSGALIGNEIDKTDNE